MTAKDFMAGARTAHQPRHFGVLCRPGSDQRFQSVGRRRFGRVDPHKRRVHHFGGLRPQQPSGVHDFAVPRVQLQKLMDAVHAPHSRGKQQHQNRDIRDAYTASKRGGGRRI